MLRPGNLLDRVNAALARDAGNVSLARYVNMPAADAVTALQGLGVQVEQVEVPSDHAAPIRDLLPSVPSGGTATLYVQEGTVVGVAAARTAATASENKTAPSGNKTTPSEGKPTPSEDKTTPSGGEPTPGEDKPTPSGGEPTPSEGKPAPRQSKPTPRRSRRQGSGQ